jgi:Methyltransferase domain
MSPLASSARSVMRSVAKSVFLRSFPVWEKLGVHVTPIHFYMPIPDTRALTGELWTKRSELPGLDMREEAQLALAERFASLYHDSYDCFPLNKTEVPFHYYINNVGFGSIDAEVLYCMIRHFKPTRIVEIGGGNSTYLSAQAIAANRRCDPNYHCQLTVIEPFPNDVLQGGFPGLSTLIRRRVQDVPLSEFEGLGEADILFIDSSHVLAIGSDVQYEFLEILPRLKRGVLVHVHDIFMPGEYPREFVFKLRRFWTEQYLLQAFLAFNTVFEVIWAGSYMHWRHPEKLETYFGSYHRNTRLPGSFWMRKVE